MNCRLCNGEKLKLVLDLGYHPPSNALLDNLDQPETLYPLRLYICEEGRLVQVNTIPAEVMFNGQYPYYSSAVPSWVQHAKEYVDMMMERFPGIKSVMEIGSNDGYLLRWFKEKGIVVLGVEPSGGPAEKARAMGIPTTKEFFGVAFTQQKNHHTGRGQFAHQEQFDLICGINVLAQCPDLNDVAEGIRIALAPDGVCTFEFPYLGNLVEQCQFDTVYHEHYSYFSLSTIWRLFVRHHLQVFAVERLPTHGGSLRAFICHSGKRRVQSGVVGMLLNESVRLDRSDLNGFAANVRNVKHDFVSFLMDIPRDKYPMAYGAAAKGNTLLNYCGIREDTIPFVSDISPRKWGKWLPGSHIPIVSPDMVRNYQPDYVIILPWNLKEEIAEQLKFIRDWGGQFVTAIPRLEVW